MKGLAAVREDHGQRRPVRIMREQMRDPHPGLCLSKLEGVGT
jgi:hypothetical protein